MFHNRHHSTPIKTTLRTYRTRTNHKNKVYVYLVYLVSPMLALIISIKNHKAPWAKNILWLFVAFYGYTMVISDEAMDASRYRDWFLQMAQSDLTFTMFIESLYSEDSQHVDVVQPFISFIISKLTSRHEVLFLTFALIFGYFYSRNIWYLLNYSGTHIKRENLLLIITFAFIIGFWQINGFRMWTAAHVFFYGAIQYLLEKKEKGFIIAIFSILIHFSFILPTILLLLFSLNKNRIQVYFWLFILSFLISEINLSQVREFSENITPSFLMDRVNSYTNETYVENKLKRAENLNWYIILYGKALKWTIFSFIIIIKYTGTNFIKSNKPLANLFGFVLLFLAVANITSLVPSGGRFMTVASLFAVAFIYMYTQKTSPEKIISKLYFFATPALLLYCVVVLRISFDTIGLVTILGSPITLLFSDFNIALIEIIK